MVTKILVANPRLRVLSMLHLLSQLLIIAWARKRAWYPLFAPILFKVGVANEQKR